jgi:hypothetical protein
MQAPRSLADRQHNGLSSMFHPWSRGVTQPMANRCANTNSRLMHEPGEEFDPGHAGGQHVCRT